MDIRITLKFLKDQSAANLSGPAVDMLPHPNVFDLRDPVFATDNERETILCLCAVSEMAHRLEFVQHMPIRRVILGCCDVPFESHEGRLTLTLPARKYNDDKAAELHTNIIFDGVHLRIEQADPLRRAGQYRDGPFPEAAHKAAVTLEFALLEAIQILKLDQSVGRGPCGPILLMGFDTNNPRGHTDWPPHVHMHMALPNYGAPIGHYYFDAQLRLSHNVLGHRNLDMPDVTFAPEETCTYRDPFGAEMYNLTITRHGGLKLTCPEGQSVSILPIGFGFDTGATLNAASADETAATPSEIHIRAQPDATTGTLRILRNDTQTLYLSDPDTGSLVA